MNVELSPPHSDLTFLTPLSEQRAHRLVDFMSAHLRGTVVDVGCGWAEILIRVLQASPDARGIGLDHNSGFIEHAIKLATQRGVADRIAFLTVDVKQHLPAQSQGAICIGASQIWGPPVEANLPMDYRSALTAIRSTLKAGSPVIYGEGVWTAPPTDDAVAPLAGRRDELVFLPDLLKVVRDCGFSIAQVHQASLDEWDVFESGYTAAYAKWLANHPADHPDAESVRDRAQKQSDAYFRGYRGVLGMAYLALFAA